MLKALRGAILALAAMQVVPAHAEGAAPVVVELYTSQGCSSCPPADALLHELSAREGVIALALHVDYWDYIGWKDEFADPAHAVRQRAYARRASKSMIYTPQMVIQGADHVVGTKPMKIADILAGHQANANPVRVTLSKTGSTLSIQADGEAGGAMDVHLVRYSPKETVRITRGENRGKTLSYANIVRDWTSVGTWNGQGTYTQKVDISGDLPIAVIVQARDYGAILGASALR
ncbi:DUF1223 domain-containing protein [Roseobacteraceae bacterium S113]